MTSETRVANHQRPCRTVSCVCSLCAFVCTLCAPCRVLGAAFCVLPVRLRAPSVRLAIFAKTCFFFQARAKSAALSLALLGRDKTLLNAGRLSVPRNENTAAAWVFPRPISSACTFARNPQCAPFLFFLRGALCGALWQAQSAAKRGAPTRGRK